MPKKNPRVVLDCNGAGYMEIVFAKQSSSLLDDVLQLCNCPKSWDYKERGHHHSCIRCIRCVSCEMTKKSCRSLKVCKLGIFNESPKKKVNEMNSYRVIIQKVMKSLQMLSEHILPLLQGIPESDKKKSCLRRMLDCRSQYEAMKQLQNVSAADVDSAEKCLYKVNCVYFDIKTMKAMSKAESSAKN